MENSFNDQLNKVKKTLSEQKEQLDSLSKLISDIEKNDLSKENEKLQTKILDEKTQKDKLISDFSKLKQEHEILKKSIFDQVLKQRDNVLKNVNKEVESYFKTSMLSSGKNIITVQSELKQKSDDLKKKLEAELITNKEVFTKQLSSIDNSVKSEIKKLHEKNMATFAEESKNLKDEIDSFSSSELTEKQIKKTIISNSAEVSAGSKLANIIGMFLILLGVIFGAQYTYSVILASPFLKSIFAFAIGIFCLSLGEWQSKKNSGFFSTGLTAGGIGILFASTAISFFNLHVISSITAAIICILVSLCAFYLSIRYNSQIIGIFAIIGGYLSITSINASSSVIYGKLAYFLILNILSLFISKEKKWLTLNFTSFFFNSIAIFFTIFFNSELLSPSITLAYVIINFIVYCLIILINPFIKKVTLGKGEIALLALNTIFHCSFIYTLIWKYNIGYLSVIYSVIFCLIFFIFAKAIDINIKDKRLSALFYLTSLVFYILCIPLQFGKAYLSTGWLFESIALIYYGVIKKDRAFETSGITIFIFCIIGFITCDLLFYLGTDNFLFKYLLITIGSIAICYAYLYKLKTDQINPSMNLSAFINAVFINTWVFLCYAAIYYSSRSEYWQYFNFGLTITHSGLLIAAISMVYGFILLKYKFLKNYISVAFPQLLFIIGILICLMLNLISINSSSLLELSRNGIDIESFKNISYYIRIVINIMAVFAFREFLLNFIKKGRVSYEYLPLAVSALILCITVQCSIFQMSIGFSSLQISFLFMLTSALWIYFGFKKLYPAMRRSGLVTAFASVIKLFLIDLYFLNQGQKIISYFVFGIVLVVISYIYQHFYKKFETMLKEEKSDSEEPASETFLEQ